MSISLRTGVLMLHELATGRRVLKRLKELNRTQWLNRDELLALQRGKLQQMLAYAYEFVPYYRRTFDQAGFHPDELQQDLRSLSKLPILTKAIIRENFDDMLTTEPGRREELSQMATSGSTGEPLIFMRDNNYRDYVTAGIQRHIGWAGWKIGEPQALIWGAKPNPSRRDVWRSRLANWVWNSFSTNAVILTDESMSSFIEQVRRRRPRVLFGYATSIYHFAQFVRKGAYQDITFDGIFSTAELLLPSVRQFIEETFGCSVFNRYATLEVGDVACECEVHDGLHVSVENNYVEIISDGRPADIAGRPGEVGDVIVTNLNNFGMPFIRYSIGDLGAWDAGAACPCGRAAPKLQSLQGRTVDTFKTQGGRTVWAGFAGSAYRCMTHPSIKQFQIVQKSFDNMVVRLAPSGEVPPATLDEIERTLQGLFGDNVQVEFEFLDEIPVLPSEKHRYAVSELGET